MNHEKAHAFYELIATGLMAVATVATAWCAYQSTLWSGVEEFQLHDAEALNREALALRSYGTNLTMLDVSIFTNYTNAHMSGNTVLSAFYRERFSPRLAPAFAAWELELRNNPSTAPRHPFEMKQYVVPQYVRADSINAVYHSSVENARNSNGFSEDFILLTVIYASVLFFGGITSNIRTLSTKRILVVVSTVSLLLALAWMFTIPLPPH